MNGDDLGQPCFDSSLPCLLHSSETIHVYKSLVDLYSDLDLDGHNKNVKIGIAP